MQISSKQLPNEVYCPTSKSHAARALIIGALKSKSFTIKEIPRAQDTQELINVLKRAGLTINSLEKDIIIENSFPVCEVAQSDIVELGEIEGGTTLRFLMPFLALGSNRYALTLKGRLLERPMDEIYDLLSQMGVTIHLDKNKVIIQGPLAPSQYIRIDCEKTTQFASAFELLKTIYPLRVSTFNLKTSKKYFELTRSMVSQLQDKGETQIPADMSSLSYFLAWGVLNQDLVVPNIKTRDSAQADDIFFDLLETMGAKFSFSSHGLKIFKTDHLQSFEIDGSGCIDLVPTLIFLAAYIKGKSIIKNIKNLRHKESDRLIQCKMILELFKVDYNYDEQLDIMSINGLNETTEGIDFPAVNDHRIVMSAALFLKQNGGGKLTHSDAVSKSFPDFFSYFG